MCTALAHLNQMSFAELEREWLRRKRGRRKERSIAALALLVVVAAAVWAAKHFGAW